MISPDLPELRLIAQFAGVAPSRLAAAFNNPEHFMEHITPDELERFQASCVRLSQFQSRLIDILDVASAAIRGAA